MWEKKQMLVTSIFFFSNVFQSLMFSRVVKNSWFVVKDYTTLSQPTVRLLMIMEIWSEFYGRIVNVWLIHFTIFEGFRSELCNYFKTHLRN